MTAPQRHPWRRGHREPVHVADVAPEPLDRHGWPAGAQLRPLSRDAAAGDITGVVSLPAGWRRPAGHLPAEAELLVLAGTVRIGGEVRGAGWYAHLPSRTAQAPWTVNEGCELYVMVRGGGPAWVPGAAGEPPAGPPLQLDTTVMPWIDTVIPGLPGGICLKVLRAVPETGESFIMIGIAPGWAATGLEFHDCSEECFILAGDVWIGSSGRLAGGSYFCRPPYVTHGPFRSQGGFTAVSWVDSTVVNNFAAGPFSTREENRLAAAAAPPPVNHLAGQGAAGG
jgi:hypothetical protein